MARVSFGSGPQALSIGPDLVYLRLMNETTQMPASISIPFKAQYDFVGEGFDNVWEAVGTTAKEAELQDADILSIKYDGVAPNGWALMSVIFASTSAARAFTAVYLGLGLDPWTIHTDEEVGSYLAFGQFVELGTEV